jgi:hypothetical protein
MQALGATAVATVILYVADQFLNSGRYFEVAANVLKQAGWSIGIHV